MDNWERFDHTSLPDTEAFCSELYREEIIEEVTDEDYILAQKVFKN